VTLMGTTSPKHTSSHRRLIDNPYVTSARAYEQRAQKGCWEGAVRYAKDSGCLGY